MPRAALFVLIALLVVSCGVPSSVAWEAVVRADRRGVVVRDDTTVG